MNDRIVVVGFEETQAKLEEIEKILFNCWKLIESEGVSIQLDILVEYISLAFHEEILKCDKIRTAPFLTVLFLTIFKFGEKTKLIHRTLLNQLLSIWVTFPKTIVGFERPILEFALSQVK